MPELPEVETIRRGLEESLIGHTVEDVDVRLRRIFHGDEKEIIGAKFFKIKRFGKALVLELDNNFSLAIHVKMTGQLVYRGKGSGSNFTKHLPDKFTHVIFRLDDGVLFYNDIRQFGWIKILKTEDVQRQNFFKELGPEPPVINSSQSTSSREKETLSLDKFKTLLHGKNTNIKVLLMDQKRIGGIGNIYANDALHLSGINPSRAAKSMTDDEAVKLYKSIITVLKRGLKYGGSSENTYINAKGEKGHYQEHALVYGKAGKSCPTCGSKISSLKIGGRGTFYCEHCQM
jgi:formamidopyrimidine-DNA glycosylase